MYFLMPDIDPLDSLPYGFDFSEWMDPTDTIATVAVVVSPDDLQVTAPMVVGQTVTVFCSHGTLNSVYNVSFEVTSTNGWVFKRTMVINCLSR